MSQGERDRLVVLRKARDKKMTQREAAEELALTERQVRRLLSGMKERGDQVVVHGLRHQVSHRRLSEERRGEIVQILSAPVYAGLGRRWRRSIWPPNTASR